MRKSRSPHGERGLKYRCAAPAGSVCPGGSLPSRGAWIEIFANRCHSQRRWSLPSRGAWIEILCRWNVSNIFGVAPLTGSVD